ncbi:peptidoglycan editing factor PgeF [Methylophaga sp.]|uniref:peptidoglycan editing factor PgeF n=1 Tax=Methylophaga sp. TaxID=2024840 RepID=UPI001401914B|nr:peptidoglycan editing factor PgeF [Methylophaga sp.]MTI63694.1 peptidoglycan editing factor PgeF [Methylophaga sp.]
MRAEFSLIEPDWPAPAQVKAFSSTRSGGISKPPYDSLNLGLHVNDDEAAVFANRKQLKLAGTLPSNPLWLEQVHGTRVIDADHWQAGIKADAIYSNQSDQVCVVMTADCLPVLFTDSAGQQVAAAHAGWRGLLNGVLENTASRFSCDPGNILAWLGPAIGPQQFEVGAEVFAAFTARSKEAGEAFRSHGSDHYLADIYLLARQRLNQLGIRAVYGGHHCTVTEADRFFSYRRDRVTGRMASLIWIEHK